MANPQAQHDSKNHHRYRMIEYRRIWCGVSWIIPPQWLCLVVLPSCLPQKQRFSHIFTRCAGSRKWNFTLPVSLRENNAAHVLRLQLQCNWEEVTHCQTQQSCIGDNEYQVGDKQTSNYWKKGTHQSQYHLDETAVLPCAGLHGVLVHYQNVKVIGNGNVDQWKCQWNIQWGG